MTNIRIYQIDRNRDRNSVAFEPWHRMMRYAGAFDFGLYDLVWDDSMEIENLDDVFEMFNLTRPEGFVGHSLSTSDIVEIVRSDDEGVKPGFYFCDWIGWKPIAM